MYVGATSWSPVQVKDLFECIAAPHVSFTEILFIERRYPQMCGVRGARGVKMEKVVLNASKRDVVGKQVKALRREGKLPAVIYGRHTEPININLDAHSAAMTLGKLTSSSLVTINVDGTEYPALVRETQRDYIKNRLLHVDFLAVSMSEKLRARVSV